jgi:hypothetical protein
MRRRSCPSPCLAPRACGLPWQFPPPSKVIARTGRQAVCRRFRRRCLARAGTTVRRTHQGCAPRSAAEGAECGYCCGPGRNSRSSPALGRAQDDDRRPSTLHEPRQHAMSGISPLRTLTRQPVPVGRTELGRRLEATLAVWAMAVSMHGAETTVVVARWGRGHMAHGRGGHRTRGRANALGAWLVAMVLGTGLAAAQGTVETQKGPPPAPNTLAPESAPPRTAPERPAIEPKPGTPALAPVPGSVDESGRPVPGDRRILGMRVPVFLTGFGALVVLLLTTGAMRRRSRADRTAPVPRGPR